MRKTMLVTAAKRPCLLLLACVIPCVAPAEEVVSGPALGERVRVRTASGRRHSGELLVWDDSNVELKLPSGKTLVLPRSDVAKVDVSTRRGQKAKAAWIGAGIGVGIGLVIGLLDNEICYRSDPSCPSQPSVVSPGSRILLVTTGAVFGALIAPGERWQPARVERVKIGLAPTPGRGFGASVAFSF